MAILSNINDKFAVDSSGGIQFSGQTGTSGYVLKSNGNAAPTWVDGSTVIGGPYLPLSGGTLTGATATASGISFTVGGTLNVNSGNDLRLYRSDNATYARFNYSGGSVGLDIDDLNSDGINLQQAGVNKLRIETSGNATFTGDLHVGGASQARFKSDGTNTYIDAIPASSSIIFRNSGSVEKMRIDSSGNVGIGLTTPTGNLSMNSQIYLGATISNTYTTNTTATRYQSFFNSGFVVTSDGLGPYPRYFDMVATGSPDGTNGGSNLRFFTTGIVAATGAELRMSITSRGRVGIGTDSPDAKLHIYGSASLSEMYLGEDAAADKAGILKYTQGNGSGTGVITLSHWGNNSLTEGLAIKYGGNVGIGTTSPTALLDFGTSIQDNKIHLYASGNDKYGMGIRGSQFLLYSGGLGSGSGGITFGKMNGTTYTENMRVTNDGNVGIGTTGPATKLTVKGATQFGGNSTSTAALTSEFSAYGTTQNLYSITLQEGAVWSPGIAVINFAASRSGLQKHYAGQIIVRLTYYNGSGVAGQGGWAAPSVVAAVVAYSGQAETYVRVYVNGSNTGNPQTIQIGVRDIDDTTNYFVSDIRVTLRSGALTITS